MSINAPGDHPEGAPELREQISAARDRVSELLLIVVGISGALGVVTNLVVTYFHDGALSVGEWAVLLAGATFTLALALVALARLRFSTREFDEEIELGIPLLVPLANSATELEVIEVGGYSNVTELGHAAVAKLPRERHVALASAARRIDRGALPGGPSLMLVPAVSSDEDDEDDLAAPSMPLAAASNDPLLWFLQLTQLIVAAQCLDESERLLGSDAVFHRGRWLRQRTPHLGDITWEQLTAGQAASHPFVGLPSLPGVRQRTTIPAAARLALTDVAAELVEAKRRRAANAGSARGGKSPAERAEETLLVPLLLVDAGRAGNLTISGVGRISAHAAPRTGQPGAGLTTRVFLRNARDHDLRRRALEEESLAMLRADAGVPRAGSRMPLIEFLPVNLTPESIQTEHARAWRALYRGARRPRVLRVYLTATGRFRVRLTGRGSVSDQSLYAWATALARRVGELDVDVLMARYAARQQVVPERRF